MILRSRRACPDRSRGAPLRAEQKHACWDVWSIAAGVLMIRTSREGVRGSFGSVTASLREAVTPLRMTGLGVAIIQPDLYVIFAAWCGSGGTGRHTIYTYRFKDYLQTYDNKSSIFLLNHFQERPWERPVGPVSPRCRQSVQNPVQFLSGHSAAALREQHCAGRFCRLLSPKRMLAALEVADCA
jgi:hypothetical protein